MAALGNFAGILVIGWMMIAGVITNAILKNDEARAEDSDFFQKVGFGIKFIFVYFVVLFVPIFVIAFLVTGGIG